VVRGERVFKLLKILVSLICMGAFAWWGFTVRLGNRTLFGHIAAIGASKESKELVRGTKEKVADLKKRIVHHENQGLEVAGEASARPGAGPAAKAAPAEHLTNADRRDMKRLLESRRGKAASGTPD
jgi:hypothetical protein